MTRTFFCFSLLAIPGCFDSHGMPGADAGRDAGPIALDGGASSACGDVVCGPGEVCCSSLCSVCGPAGEVCPDIDCLPDCAPDDASGVGPCFAELGWRWTGSSCESIGGCTCEGTDCGALSSTFESCTALHAHCTTGCGGRGGLVCPPDQFCDFEDDSCGRTHSFGTCRPRPTDCPEPGGVPVCGCDGVDYWADCPANLSGVDRAHFGSCSEGGYRFARAEPTCAPWDGPAWRLIFTETRVACDSPEPALSIEVWTDLNDAAPATYRVGAAPDVQGSAMLCTTPGAPCIVLEGTITIEAFFTGEVARLSYALDAADGSAYVESGIELTGWCAVTFPGCG